MNRLIYTILGWLTLGLAFIGIALPVLPTTPFILLSAFFFSKGSPQVHRWILNHPVFGKSVKDWQAGRGISLKSKILAISTLWISITLSALYAVEIIWVRSILFAIALGVTIFLILIKTKK